MNELRRPSRRAVLTGIGGLALGSTTAGCLGDDSDADDDPTADPPDDDGTTDTAGGGASDDTDGDGTEGPPDDTSTDGLDLREANVVGVSVEAVDDGHRFDVTLHHDDDGEDGYADRWQVERLDGTVLGRRELLHAHSTRPFTRSETVEIPAAVTCVVVRGHDQTHGYGGQAMLVDVDSGATRAIEQGTERETPERRECP